MAKYKRLQHTAFLSSSHTPNYLHLNPVTSVDGRRVQGSVGCDACCGPCEAQQDRGHPGKPMADPGQKRHHFPAVMCHFLTRTPRRATGTLTSAPCLRMRQWLPQWRVATMRTTLGTIRTVTSRLVLHLVLARGIDLLKFRGERKRSDVAVWRRTIKKTEGQKGGWADGRMGGWADGRMGGGCVRFASLYLLVFVGRMSDVASLRFFPRKRCRPRHLEGRQCGSLAPTTRLHSR